MSVTLIAKHFVNVLMYISFSFSTSSPFRCLFLFISQNNGRASQYTTLVKMSVSIIIFADCMKASACCRSAEQSSLFTPASSFF